MKAPTTGEEILGQNGKRGAARSGRGSPTAEGESEPARDRPHGCGWSQVGLGCDTGTRCLHLCPTSLVEGPKPARWVHIPGAPEGDGRETTTGKASKESRALTFQAPGAVSEPGGRQKREGVADGADVSFWTLDVRRNQRKPAQSSKDPEQPKIRKQIK